MYEDECKKPQLSRKEGIALPGPLNFVGPLGTKFYRAQHYLMLVL